MKLTRLIVAAILLYGTAHAQSVTDFYADRTVTILIGSGAGGATDISARVIARFLGQHIPGTPTVIAQNMPGGGGVTMTNHIYRSAPKDGTTLGYSLPGVITAQLLEPNRTGYDGRNLNWIGSALKYTGIISVIDSAPATSIAEARQTELFIGATGRGSPAYQFPAMAQALLNLRFRMITGYASSNEVALAMERGEVHGQSSSLQYWAISRPDWLSNGRIVHLLYVGPRDPLGTPGVPYLRDMVSTDREKALVDFIEIGSRLGWPLFAPPNVPVERVEALRFAFQQLTEDAEFAAAFETTVKGRLSPSTGAVLEEFVSQALDTPAAIVAETKRILGLDD